MTEKVQMAMDGLKNAHDKHHNKMHRSVGDYIIPSYHNGGIVTFSTTVQSWLIWGTAIALVRLSREEKEKQRIALESAEDDEEYA